MTALGFKPTPRGYHSREMGTANSTIVLRDDTYVELLGVVSPTDHSTFVSEAVVAGRSLLGLILKTDDAEQTQAAFEAAGINGGALREFSRPVSIMGAQQDAVFRTAHVADGTVAGVHVFACEHRSPDLVWRNDYLDQPNCVVGISSLIGVAVDPRAAAADWQKVPGVEVQTSDDVAQISFRDQTLRIFTPARFVELYGMPPSAVPGLAAITFRTSDEYAARRTLRSSGINMSKTERGFYTAAFGILICFEAH